MDSHHLPARARRSLAVLSLAAMGSLPACKSGNSTLGPGCETNAPCASGFTCVNGKCLQICNVDADCKNGEGCASGICVVKTNSCVIGSGGQVVPAGQFNPINGCQLCNPAASRSQWSDYVCNEANPSNVCIAATGSCDPNGNSGTCQGADCCQFGPAWPTGSTDRQPACPLAGQDPNQNGVQDAGETWTGLCGHDGTCTGCSNDSQCDDGNQCTPDSCDVSTGTCKHDTTSRLGSPCAEKSPSDGTCDALVGGGIACLLHDGQPCTTDDECENGSCANGYCCDSACDGTCQRCDVTPGTCTACDTNATCDSSTNSCTCDAGYDSTSTPAGYTCQNHDDCTPDPCQNGGTCTDQVNSYQCTCPSTNAGAQCQYTQTDCLAGGSQLCDADFGTCVADNGSYCTCKDCLTGQQCTALDATACRYAGLDFPDISAPANLTCDSSRGDGSVTLTDGSTAVARMTGSAAVTCGVNIGGITGPSGGSCPSANPQPDQFIDNSESLTFSSFEDPSTQTPATVSTMYIKLSSYTSNGGNSTVHVQATDDTGEIITAPPIIVGGYGARLVVDLYQKFGSRALSSVTLTNDVNPVNSCIGVENAIFGGFGSCAPCFTGPACSSLDTATCTLIGRFTASAVTGNASCSATAGGIELSATGADNADLSSSAGVTCDNRTVLGFDLGGNGSLDAGEDLTLTFTQPGSGNAATATDVYLRTAVVHSDVTVNVSATDASGTALAAQSLDLTATVLQAEHDLAALFNHQPLTSITVSIPSSATGAQVDLGGLAYGGFGTP